jgi:hypothetical protein
MEEKAEVTLFSPDVVSDPGQIDPKLAANVDARKIAQEALEFIEDELKDQITPRFWEIIRDHAIEKAGLPVRHIVGIQPLDKDQAQAFAETLMPNGKYAGQKIATVLKKNKQYLEQFADQPSSFQRKLKKFLLSK